MDKKEIKEIINENIKLTGENIKPGDIQKIKSQSATPIFHHTASTDCPNRPAMRPICFFV